MCGIECVRGESCTERELWAEESFHVFGWVLVCAEGNCPRPGKNPEKNRGIGGQNMKQYPGLTQDWEEFLLLRLERPPKMESSGGYCLSSESNIDPL